MGIVGEREGAADAAAHVCASVQNGGGPFTEQPTQQGEAQQGGDKEGACEAPPAPPGPTDDPMQVDDCLTAPVPEEAMGLTREPTLALDPSLGSGQLPLSTHPGPASQPPTREGGSPPPSAAPLPAQKEGAAPLPTQGSGAAESHQPDHTTSNAAVTGAAAQPNHAADREAAQSKSPAAPAPAPPTGEAVRVRGARVGSRRTTPVLPPVPPPIALPSIPPQRRGTPASGTPPTGSPTKLPHAQPPHGSNPFGNACQEELQQGAQGARGAAHQAGGDQGTGASGLNGREEVRARTLDSICGSVSVRSFVAIHLSLFLSVFEQSRAEPARQQVWQTQWFCSHQGYWPLCLSACIGACIVVFSCSQITMVGLQLYVNVEF